MRRHGRRVAARLLVAVFLVAGVACGGRQVAPPPPEGMPPFALLDAPPDDLTGTWAQLQVTTAESSGGLAGTVVSTNRRVLLLDIVEHDDGRLTMDGVLCAMTVDTASAVASTVVPEAFVDTFPPVAMSAQVARARRELDVAFDTAWETVGGAPLAPDAPMPAGPDDPLAVDTDGDGHPGVTIEVTGLGGGEMYFAQRTSRDLVVESADGAFLDGAITWTSDRVVLDATSRPLRNARETVPTNDPERNWFRSTRVAPGTTCDDVVAAGDALFVRRSADLTSPSPEGSGAAPISEAEAP